MRLAPAAEPPDALASLPNLGPRSQQMLQAAGVHSLAELRRLGAVAAYARARHACGGRASLNLLWALEGALTGLPWQQAGARAPRQPAAGAGVP